MSKIGTATVIESRKVHHTAALGLPPSPRKRNVSVITAAAMKWSLSFAVPCRVVSESNKRCHWSARRRRFIEQSQAVYLAWLRSPFMHIVGSDWERRYPVTVTLTHIGPKMDDDNLVGAFKGIRDKIAAQVFGTDDGDERVRWAYEQRLGEPGVSVRIEGQA